MYAFRQPRDVVLCVQGGPFAGAGCALPPTPPYPPGVMLETAVHGQATLWYANATKHINPTNGLCSTQCVSCAGFPFAPPLCAAA